MAKRKKKKAAVGETALPKGVPFDRQRERPLKWGIAIFKGLCWSRRSLWAPSALSLLLMRGLLSSAFSSGLCCSPIPM